MLVCIILVFGAFVLLQDCVHRTQQPPATPSEQDPLFRQPLPQPRKVTRPSQHAGGGGDGDTGTGGKGATLDERRKLAASALSRGRTLG